ncbi:hypothetical protein OA40_13480 [Morganella morganii]|nr:hypothetical protein OA40_13480 [Morganella morganii]KNZ88636.1 hypothetical protein AKG16_09235 [Morganella morganii]KOO20181.1 hypothetical protein AC068_03210 [Morganella morganii]
MPRCGCPWYVTLSGTGFTVLIITMTIVSSRQNCGALYAIGNPAQAFDITFLYEIYATLPVNLKLYVF